jgi:hypothetical protein
MVSFFAAQIGSSYVGIRLRLIIRVPVSIGLRAQWHN